jgi:protoheme IX farnesyltransferase
MGWTAVRNGLSAEAWVLFAILFLWQMPHFFSLAWMYRRDYARAGFKILTVSDASGERTSRQIFWYTLALIPASISPAFLGMTGILSTVGALLLGIGFLTLGIMLMRFAGLDGAEAIGKVNSYSRRMFFASLVYLPLLMLMMTIDKL